jgi:hypothetical protein
MSLHEFVIGNVTLTWAQIRTAESRLYFSSNEKDEIFESLQEHQDIGLRYRVCVSSF